MRVLVVEDENRVLGFIVQSLREAGFAVDESRDGREALQLALVHTYDAIVLDLVLPAKTGLQVLEALRAAGRTTPVLVLTARDSIDDRVRGLDAGADDYLTKPFAIAELLARVRALLRRGSAPPSVLRVGDLCIDLLTKKVERAGRSIELTAREFALLEYLARHVGEVVTRTMILEHVWDMNFDGLSNVVDVYILYLRRKIDKDFEAKLIHTRRGVGYVMTNAP